MHEHTRVLVHTQRVCNSACYVFLLFFDLRVFTSFVKTVGDSLTLMKRNESSSFYLNIFEPAFSGEKEGKKGYSMIEASKLCIDTYGQSSTKEKKKIRADRRPY